MGENDKTYSQEIRDRIRELAHSMWEWAGRQQGMALHYSVTPEKGVLATTMAHLHDFALICVVTVNPFAKYVVLLYAYL